MEKKTLLILIFSVIVTGFSFIQAQKKNSGAGFAYQAVLRDINGDVLSEKDIQLTFSLYTDQSQNPADAWKQTKTLKTDKFGVVKTIVGKADDNQTVATGFTDINFNEAHYWFKVELLQEGSNTTREISFAQLPSTPYSESAFSVSYSVPVGTIVPFAGDKIPEGWLLCDGSTYDGNDAKYSELSSVVGVFYKGSANLSPGEFRVPDFRGTFLRGADQRTKEEFGMDPDRPRRIGSLQEAATDIRDFKGNFNALTFNGWYPGNIIAGGNITGTLNGAKQGFQYEGDRTSVQAAVYTLTPPEKYTTETRPINHAVNYIIKY